MKKIARFQMKAYAQNEKKQSTDAGQNSMGGDAKGYQLT
jgi:hypothetical protein